MTNTEKRINVQEYKYRYITSTLLQEMFHMKQLIIRYNHPEEHTDLDMAVLGTNHNVTYTIEVKERNKDFDTYPNVELRKDKLERIFNKGNYDNYIYIVYGNKETAYIYDLKKIDWNKCTSFTYHIKRTEYEEDKEIEYVDYPAWSIPLDQAMYKIPCTRYYDNYNQIEMVKELIKEQHEENKNAA